MRIIKATNVASTLKKVRADLPTHPALDRFRSLLAAIDHCAPLTVFENQDTSYRFEDLSQVDNPRVLAAGPWATILEAADRISWFERATRGVTLVLPSEKVLNFTISFPRAALKNLGDVLRIEIGRLTPFRWDDVYVTHELLSSDVDGGSLQTARLYIVKRAFVDPFADDLSRHGLRLLAVSTKSEVEASRAINVIAGAKVQSRTLTSEINSAIAFSSVLAIGLICGWLGIQTWRNYTEAAALNAAAAIEIRSAAAMRIKETSDSDRLRRLEFLGARKADEPSFMKVWNELTKAIPDTAWLTDLQGDNGNFQMSGFARSASELVSLLAAEPTFVNVSFIGPVTRDPRSSLERFQIRFATRRGS